MATVHHIRSWPDRAHACGGNWPALTVHKYVTGLWIIQFAWAWFGTRHWIQVVI